jgi:hypothetical protein
MNSSKYFITSFVTLLVTLLLIHRSFHERSDTHQTFSRQLSSAFSDLIQPPSIRNLAHSKIDFKEAIILAQDVLNLIRHRYELDGIGSQLFLSSNNIDKHTWDVIKYKLAKKILGQEQFLMTFGGSSVTAGHDNYYNQSYPAVVDRRLTPILKALGVDLIVRNIAQGELNFSFSCILHQYFFDTKSKCFSPDAHN